MASGKLATKYGKLYADKLGVKGNFGTQGVDDITARNAFHSFMTNPENFDTALYWNISSQLYHWHSLADVRALEYWLDCGIRPTEDHVQLINKAYEKGSSIPKFYRPVSVMTSLMKGGREMSASPETSHSNDELVSPEEVNDFMLKIGYVKMNAVKDHREVTRFEDPSHELQNISVPLAVLLTMHFKTHIASARKEGEIVGGIDELNKLIGYYPEPRTADSFDGSVYVTKNLVIHGRLAELKQQQSKLTQKEG